MTATLEKNQNLLTEPRPLRWTKEQYHRMGDEGLLLERHVELIEGEILEMSPMNSPHWATCVLVDEALREVFPKGSGYVVVQQLPLSVMEESEPEPDVAVIKGAARDFKTNLPTSAVLVVEVSDSTLIYDKGRKLKLYARAEISEYWILDVKARRLIVHRAPNAAEEQFDNVQTLKETDVVSLLEAPSATIKIADLLP